MRAVRLDARPYAHSDRDGSAHPDSHAAAADNAPHGHVDRNTDTDRELDGYRDLRSYADAHPAR
jgi:hypothetical protein